MMQDLDHLLTAVPVTWAVVMQQTKKCQPYGP